MRRRCIFWIVIALLGTLAPVRAEQPIDIKYTRQQLEEKWRARIQSFLDQGVIPLIDFLSFMPRKSGEPFLVRTSKVMDEAGVALMTLGGYWAAGGNKEQRYRWGYYIRNAVNTDPDRFVLSTNKGGNRNWWKQKGAGPRSFIGQLEKQVRGSDYTFISQIEFRHYMSNAQCKSGKTDRDLDIPLDGKSGRRIFQLSAETGVAFSINLEPEDAPLAALEKMLSRYPKAKVIVSHFGQIRHPEREKQSSPQLVRRLLTTYSNLYYDLSTGEPGRRYRCASRPLDSVIWQDDGRGGQKKKLKAEYKTILTEFSGRFVAGFDYGPENRQSRSYLRRRIANMRLILRDLPDNAKHDIGYRNGWRLLTGRRWKAVK